MKVLLGTTNPSKIARFTKLLHLINIDTITLDELMIDIDVEETGLTPEENAIKKALIYNKYYDYVLCNDAGLYFEELKINDPLQPGLHVRTPNNSPRLNDEEMVDYYSNLIQNLGGRVHAYYLDGIAVGVKGNIKSYMNAFLAKKGSFLMMDKRGGTYFPGWPLDAISYHKDSLKCFTEQDKRIENIMIGEYEEDILNFLKEALKEEIK